MDLFCPCFFVIFAEIHWHPTFPLPWMATLEVHRVEISKIIWRFSRHLFFFPLSWTPRAKVFDSRRLSPWELQKPWLKLTHMAWVIHTVPCLGDRWSSHRESERERGGWERERVVKGGRGRDALMDWLKRRPDAGLFNNLSVCWKPDSGSFASPFQLFMFFICFCFGVFLVRGWGEDTHSYRSNLHLKKRKKQKQFAFKNERVSKKRHAHKPSLVPFWCSEQRKWKFNPNLHNKNSFMTSIF